MVEHNSFLEELVKILLSPVIVASGIVATASAVIANLITKQPTDEAKSETKPVNTSNLNMTAPQLADLMSAFIQMQYTHLYDEFAPKLAKIIKQGDLDKGELEATVQKEASALLQDFELASQIKASEYEEQHLSSENDTNTKPILSCNNIMLSLSNNFKLSVQSFEVKSGEIIAITGPNGCGKSTFLKILAGEIEVNNTANGKYPIDYVFLNDRTNVMDWEAIKHGISYVAQRPLPFNYPVAKELKIKAAFRGFTERKLDKHLEYILVSQNITQHQEALWTELSGGQQAHVTLAKAICGFPSLVLLDEPLAPLDPGALSIFMTNLQIYAKNALQPTAVVFSSQHIDECESIADKVVFMSNGEMITKSFSKEQVVFELSLSNSTQNDRQKIISKLNENKNLEATLFGTHIILKAPRPFGMHDVLTLFGLDKEPDAIRNITESVKRYFIK